MQTRRASIKETGEELSPAEWERFDAAVAELKAERRRPAGSDVQEERLQGADQNNQAVA